jgi:hypothetical protein
MDWRPGLATLVSGRGAWLHKAAGPGPLLPPLGQTAGGYLDGGLLEIRGRTARFWDPATGKPHTPPLEHDEDVVIAVRRPGVFIWTVTASGHRFWTDDGRPAGAVQKHPDGARVVAAGRSTTAVWLREARGDFFLWYLSLLEDVFKNPAGDSGRRRSAGAWRPRRVTCGLSDFFTSPDGRWLVLTETTGDSWLRLATGRRTVMGIADRPRRSPRRRVGLRPKPTGRTLRRRRCRRRAVRRSGVRARGGLLATVTPSGEVQVRRGHRGGEARCRAEDVAWPRCVQSRQPAPAHHRAHWADPIAGAVRWRASGCRKVAHAPPLEVAATPCFMPDGERRSPSREQASFARRCGA